jgi:hypothetical protein
MNANATIEEWVSSGSLAGLGPERRPDAWPVARIETMLNSSPNWAKIGKDSRNGMEALLLLWHDHLDASHEISQSLHNEDGSYLHGMMHRREPDYFNAKYWFRRIPNHPAFLNFAEALRAQSGAGEKTVAQLFKAGQWDPFAFVDLCEQARNQPPEMQRALQEIQRQETLAMLRWLVKPDVSIKR